MAKGLGLLVKEATAIAGSLGEPSKMPGYSYGIPARNCLTGTKLHNVPDTVCADCYALKGNYIFPDVLSGQARRLASLTNPLWVDAMVKLIGSKQKLTTRDGSFFRWHDSGDLQSADHLENIAQVARRLPTVKFWLPTREYQIVREWFGRGNSLPTNLTIRLSAHIVDGPLPTKLAALLGRGVTVSGVHTNEDGRHGEECQAYTRDNHCGDCRLCWNPDVAAVSYRQH